MKFHSYWDLQTPQFKASVGSVDDVRTGYVAGYSYGHDDCRVRLNQLEREQKTLATAIRNMAVEAGICSDEALLTGAHLIMLCSDMLDYLKNREREVTELRAKVAAYESAQEITVPDDMQEWAGMDGATAFHLIERHADNWSDAGKMMHEWLNANIPQPKEGE